VELLSKEKNQICLLWALDHATNTPIAYTFGTREYKYLDELLELLKPFNVRTVYTDDNFAYSSRISTDHLVVSKKNTQQIERNHLTLRTRIKRLCRKTICFSKNKDIHKAVIGTFINTFFFGRKLSASTIL
jgi:insertion element IS1 protein InsB